MNITIGKSKIHGEIEAPPSKSATHRALFMAAMSSGDSHISPIIESDDTLVTKKACTQLGAKINLVHESALIRGIQNHKQNQTPTFVDCKMSGTTLRLLTAIAVLQGRKITIDGSKRLRERPIHTLVQALRDMGASINYLGSNEHIPIQIDPATITQNGVSIDGTSSSQYTSALLMVAPLLPKGLIIKTTGNLVSKPYIDITISMMQERGITLARDGYHKFTVEGNQEYLPSNYTLEGDYSSAMYVAAAATITKSKVTITNLQKNSSHPDKKVLQVLEKMGSNIVRKKDTVTVEHIGPIYATNQDLSDCPDAAPTLVAVAAYAKGKSIFTGISHLKHKESDRLKDTTKVFKKIGVDIKATNDKLIIEGQKPTRCVTDSAGDHRLAMALGIAALGSPSPITIENAEVAKKSWPNFFKTIKKLDANITYG